MRGKEENFLKSNRPTAKCILDQQCRKLSKNPEEVKTTLKAFKKLFDNGHMVLLKDMPQETPKKLRLPGTEWLSMSLCSLHIRLFSTLSMDMS